MVMSILPNSWPIKFVTTFYAQNSCFLGFFMPKWMKNSFFYAEILNTDCTLNPIKISKKSKILNMPKMAQNGAKWPKLGPNTSYFCILRLNLCIWTVKRPLKSMVMSVLPNSWPIKYVSTFYAQNSCFLGFSMPQWMKNMPFWAYYRLWTFKKGSQDNFRHEVKTFSVLKSKIKRCWGLILAVLGHFGTFWAILGMFKILNFFEIFFRCRVLSVLSTTVKKNPFFIHLSIKKTKKQLFWA